MSNNIVLDGGELQGNFGGAIDVVSDSKLNHGNGYTLFYGQLSGDADLMIRGEYVNGYVGIFGDASQFTGDLHVESGALRIGRRPNSAMARSTSARESQLVLGSNRPDDGQTIVERDIHIHRGSLYATPPSDTFEPDTPNGVVMGNVYVQDAAFVGANALGKISNQRVPGLVLGGRVVLEDGAMIIGQAAYNAVYFIDEVPLVEVAGDLEVGKDNVWRLELANVGITGTIRARVPDASIDFQGPASMINMDQASIVAEAGRSLSITVNGEARELQLAAPGAGLAGNGSLAGKFQLSDGATIAPGASPGLLTIAGDLGLGAAAVYEWEIDNLAGGPGVGWDLLDVEGTLAFNATPDVPWILEIHELNNASLLGGTEWLIASATTIDGFDSASVQVTLDSVSDEFRLSTAGQLTVELRGTDLYLVRTVPEPPSMPCVAVLCLMLLGYTRTSLINKRRELQRGTNMT